LSAEFVDDFTERKGNLLQAGKQAFIVVIRERGEQAVFNRLSSSWDHGHD